MAEGFGARFLGGKGLSHLPRTPYKLGDSLEKQTVRQHPVQTMLRSRICSAFTKTLGLARLGYCSDDYSVAAKRLLKID
jgi:hypothetical protein